MQSSIEDYEKFRLSKIKELPSDPRTLLGTSETTPTRNFPPGNYFHYGLKNALIDQFQHLDVSKISSDIEINIHIDGLPLAKSSNSQFYLILGQMFPLIAEPFVIGIYDGYEKPHSSNSFLEAFINEYKNLHLHRFEYLKKTIKVTIRVVICDSPARNYLTCTKSNNAYFGCGKYRDEGDYMNNRMFLDLNAQLRTDENFLQRIDEEHHTGASIFEDADIGMVSQFPLDYMHLVCLGVTKKFLLTYVKGPHRHKFSAKMISEISTRLIVISKWIPSEFARKCRAISYVDRWKATEFRLFLLYVGPVPLQGYLSREYMQHFIALHYSVRILCHEEGCKFNNEYANNLLVYFVENCKPLYGSHFLIYNIHNLNHLASDIFQYRSLDSFSAFPFESFLNTLKKKQLRKGDKTLQQLHHRIVERATCYFKNPNVFNEEVRLEGKNEKGADEFGVDSYYTIYSKKFKLSLRGQRNRFCYLEEGDTTKIICIENIAMNKENKSILIGQSLINSIGFPDYPIDSKEFDIAVGNEWSQVTIFEAKNIKMKAICVPYETSFCFVPLLHTSTENSLEHNGY